MAEHRQQLSRELSLFDITMIGVGAMIGAGIFVLTGEAAGTAGPALVLSFALNAVITLLTAMVYAELGSAIPEAGGGYLWIREGLPGANAFLAGWMSWFAHAVGKEEEIEDDAGAGEDHGAERPDAGGEDGGETG